LPLAQSMLAEHPIAGVAPENLVILSPQAILKRYRVKMSLSTHEISFMFVSTKDHLTVGDIYLLLITVILFSVLFQVRMVYLRPSMIRTKLTYRFNVRSQLEIGFRSKGFWVLQGLQVASIAVVLISFWGSDRMSSLRKNSDSTDAQVIYWFTAIFINVSVLMEAVNVLLLTFVGLFYPTDGDQQQIMHEVQKTRARVFVITHGLHIATLLIAVWIILLERTSIDFTNLAAALWSMFLVPFAILCPLVLLDRLVHPTNSEASQLWFTPWSNSRSEHGLPTQWWSYIYAVFVIVWLSAWAVWVFYFSAVLQVYEEAKFSMPDMRDSTVLILSLCIAFSSVGSGFVLAKIITQMNHIAAPDANKE
jgi:hypothetical protein